MVVLISGASGGLGQVLGSYLQQQGETVYGTSRSPGKVQEKLSFPLLQLDVLEQQSVDGCIAELLSRESHIDVLINCVNEMFIGSVEETDVDEVATLYNTNVFGVMRLCKAVVPAMKAQGKGTIVNMSSLGGLLAVPYMSAYTSAKFALEAFSEAFYQEMKPFNIQVSIMQPVAMYMNRPVTGQHLRTVAGAGVGSLSHIMVKRMARDTAASKLTPELVSAKIYQLIRAGHKPLRVPMDKARAISLLKRFAPQVLIDKLVGGLVKPGAGNQE
jgi:short-subunit dehydrogenase